MGRVALCWVRGMGFSPDMVGGEEDGWAGFIRSASIIIIMLMHEGRCQFGDILGIEWIGGGFALIMCCLFFWNQSKETDAEVDV